MASFENHNFGLGMKVTQKVTLKFKPLYKLIFYMLHVKKKCLKLKLSVGTT